MDLNMIREYLMDNFWLVRHALVAVLILIAFMLLRKIFTRYIIKLIQKFTRKTPTKFDEILIGSFEKPLQVFIVIIGIYLAMRSLPLKPATDAFIILIFRSSVVVFGAWGLYNFAGDSSELVSELSDKLNLDKILIPFLSKFFRFVLIMLTFSIIAQEWGYDVNGFIAGLGLGGLAFALAAQDTLANIFAGIVIITDKPFSIGDWIKTPDVEGTVEDMNFRNTRIRTFAQAVVTVPNRKLVDNAIINWSRMGRRRITFNLGVTYTTPRDKLQICVDRIKQMLVDNTDISNETIFVTFDTFNSSSLDIFLYFFTNTTNWGEFLKVKESVNFKIMGILEEEGVSVAFPSTSVYFETPLKRSEL